MNFESIENMEKENEQKITTNLTDPTRGSRLILMILLVWRIGEKKDYNETFPLNVDVKQKLYIRIDHELKQVMKI